MRYAGVLAAAHKLRSLVVPPCAVDDKSEAINASSDAHSHTDDQQRLRAVPPLLHARVMP
jgi:hypothetical protein